MAIVVQNDNLSFGLGRNAMVTFKGKGEENHTAIKVEEQGGGSGKIALWGEDNRFPQNFMKTLRKNGAGSASYRFLKAAHYGQGFRLYKTEDDEGKEKKQVVALSAFPEIAEFFRRNRMHRVFTEVIADLEHFSLGWPEFILTNDYNKLHSVRRLPTAKMRYEKINPKTGLIENGYFSHNWTSGLGEDSEFVKKIAVVDSYCSADEIRDYCKSKKIHKFTMPIFFPMIDETYYPEPDHHSVYHNGWMEVVNSIPEYKKNFSENQLNIKYMVYISEEYFTRTYRGEWEKYTVEKKTEIRQQLTESIDEHLSGNKNAGKSIQSTVFKDSTGDWVKGIEVVPLKEENTGEGKGLLDSSAGNSEIMSAIGTDPNLMGVGIPGGKLNSGSGSDKREAFSILNSLMKTKRETTLEIWRVLRDFNGWDPNLEGDFAVTELTTLDKNPTGTENKL